MFAVPGWSVSADALAAQVELGRATSAQRFPSDSAHTIKKESRKRKRGHGSSNVVEVTEDNLAELWRKHIEKNSTDVQKDKPVERQKKKDTQNTKGTLGKSPDVNGVISDGFSGGENNVLAKRHETSLKGIEKAKKEEPDSLNEANSYVHATEDPGHASYHPEVEDGKARYARRKAKAAQKREWRALLQADGTLPPSRPDPDSEKGAQEGPTRLLNHPASSRTVAAPQKTVLKKSEKIPKAPGPANPPTAPNSAETINPTLPSAKLTPLQQRMAAKLTSARFRHLNQTLYTSPSDHAMRLFTDSPQAYTSYHAGFRAQVAVWPQNPLESFIEDVKVRARISVPSQKKLWREQKNGKKRQGGNATADGDVDSGIPKADPLPRSRSGTCTIVDLGCGDARLAASLSPLAKALSLRTLSFDLAKGDSPNAHLVTVADVTNLSAAGVKDGSVDVAICCLSLMGTNWVDVVDECARAVRGGGEVWVAEIKSRFARPGAGKKSPKDREKHKGKRKKGDHDDGNGVEEAPAAIAEVENANGTGEKKDETDVNAFVEIFRKRGFLLKGEPDMANKMFVRMRFVLSWAVGREKGDEEGPGKGRNGPLGKGKIYGKTKFVEEDKGEEVDESKVLKPCVYKNR